MKDNQVTILWLYDDLLDLYGDCGNLMLLQRRIADMGLTCLIRRASLADELEFEDVDMVYIGPGKFKNLIIAANHLLQYRDKLLEYVEQGGLMLATGSSRMLLGKSIEAPDHSVQECVGIFEYTAQETGDVDTHDLLVSMQTEPKALCYGFINRTAALGSETGDTPMFRLHSSTPSKAFPQGTEGLIYKNLYSTWMLGPVLVKNPPLARFFLKELLGERFQEYDDSLEEKAQRFTLEEFLPKE